MAVAESAIDIARETDLVTALTNKVLVQRLWTDAYYDDGRVYARRNYQGRTETFPLTPVCKSEGEAWFSAGTFSAARLALVRQYKEAILQLASDNLLCWRKTTRHTRQLAIHCLTDTIAELRSGMRVTIECDGHTLDSPHRNI